MPTILYPHDISQEESIIKVAHADAGMVYEGDGASSPAGPRQQYGPSVSAIRQSQPSRRSTPTKAKADKDKLAAYMDGKPLAAFVDQLAASEYGATIVGICAIEQWACSRAPHHNYWGIFCGKTLCRYGSPEEGIRAIDALLTKYESRGRDTIEELNGYYVVPASPNWYATVTKVQAQLQ